MREEQVTFLRKWNHWGGNTGQFAPEASSTYATIIMNMRTGIGELDSRKMRLRKGRNSPEAQNKNAMKTTRLSETLHPQYATCLHAFHFPNSETQPNPTQHTNLLVSFAIATPLSLDHFIPPILKCIINGVSHYYIIFIYYYTTYYSISNFKLVFTSII